MLIKTIMRYHLISLGWSLLKKKKIINDEKNVEKLNPYAPLVRMLNGMDPMTISRSDCACQTPVLLGPGKDTKCRPTKSAPLRASWALSLRGLDRGGACSLGPASDGSPAEQCRAWAVCAASRGKPSLDEILQAHASSICLQHPSLPKARLNSEPKKKKCPPPPSLCQDGNQTLKRPANRGS